jgi:LuxR family transcriptional regulator, maltose regulon positive regulatory protein
MHPWRGHAHDVLERDRLTRTLKGARNELILLAAPPGFGKTTLLHQWEDVDERPFAWVTVEATTNDAFVLWKRIIEAIRVVEPDFQSSAETALRSPHADILWAIVPLIAHDLRTLNRELVIVLDDYQAIDDRLCHDSVSLFLDWLPQDVTFVLSTRADPPIPVGVLRARGELLELRAVDLCFTADEEASLLNEKLGLGLGPATLATLHERTEGWPAGVYLASLSLQKTGDRTEFVAGFKGSNRHVVDYLTEVVLDTLDERQRQFLLATSILDSICAPLAEAVTGEADSAGLLEAVEHANLFLLALDDERRWYRFHQLFRELLHAQLLRQSREQAATLHRRASEWYAEAGRVDDAIRHAVAAGDVDAAIGLVVERWSPRLSCTEARTTLRRLDVLPPEAASADARLLLARAWATSLVGERHDAARALEAAAAAGLEGTLPDGSSLEAAAAAVEASFPRGDAKEMLAAARRVKALEQGLAPAWVPVVQLSRGWAEYLAGNWRKAEAALQEAAASATDLAQWPHVSVAKALYSRVALAAEDHEVAEAFAHGSVEVLESHDVADTFAWGVADVALGAVLARSNADSAESSFDRGIERLRAQTEPLLLAEALVGLAPVRRALRGPKAGRECLEEARALLDGCEDPGILAERLERVARTLTPAYRRAKGDTDLTERELEVLRYLADGLPKRDIGAALYLSYNTIHSHTKSIYQKLRVSSREAAVARARELGAL